MEVIDILFVFKYVIKMYSVTPQPWLQIMQWWLSTFLWKHINCEGHGDSQAVLWVRMRRRVTGTHAGEGFSLVDGVTGAAEAQSCSREEDMPDAAVFLHQLIQHPEIYMK